VEVLAIDYIFLVRFVIVLIHNICFEGGGLLDIDLGVAIFEKVHFAFDKLGSWTSFFFLDEV